MNPSTHKQAAAVTRSILERHIVSLDSTSKILYRKVSPLIGDKIWRRWHKGPYQWKLKHAAWYLRHGTEDYDQSTRALHYDVMVFLLRALDRGHWLRSLDGPWNDHVTKNSARLEYSRYAIDSLRYQAAHIKPHAPRSSAAMHRICDLMEGAQKFILPANADLIDRSRSRAPYADLVRLPYPATLFEYQSPATLTERIVLSWHTSEHCADEPCFDVSRGHVDGIIVASVTSDGSLRDWKLSSAFAFFPLQSSLDASPTLQLDTPDRSSILTKDAPRDSSVARNTIFRPLLPEIYSMHLAKVGERQGLLDVRRDLEQDLNAMIDACLVLSCKNVSTKTLQEPRSKNMTRETKGELPLFEYKLLDVGLTPTESRPESSGVRGKSPRAHLRRAHLRRLPKKTVYVRATVVNPRTTKGSLQKDYRLSKHITHQPDYTPA